MIATTDLTGRVLERYYYSPYGQLKAVQYADTPDLDLDGDIEQDDEDMIRSGSDCWGPPSGVCLRADFNCDNTVNAVDLTLMQKKRASLSGDMEMRRVPAAPRSQLGNPFAHQGLQLDPEIGTYQNRTRQYAPKLKRFMQRDPLVFRRTAGSGYRDGLGLYCYLRSSPLSTLDPYGLAQIRWRKHPLWPFPPKYHVGIDIDTDGDGNPDYTLDYGWDGLSAGKGLSCCNNNTTNVPPDRAPKPKGPIGGDREYPDGEDNWTEVSDCVGDCLSDPIDNYGLYCILGIPFPFDCSNSSGALHAEVRRCRDECEPVGDTGTHEGDPEEDPPWVPGWINDWDMPGWDNVPDGAERTCAEIWG